MSVNVSVADEATFKQFARRIHKELKARDATTLPPLGHIQEAVIRALGHRSLHDARQAWATPEKMMAGATPGESAAPVPPIFPIWDMPSAWAQEPIRVQDELLRGAARGCHDQLRGYTDEFGDYRDNDLPPEQHAALASLTRIRQARTTIVEELEAEARQVLQTGDAQTLSDIALQALEAGPSAWQTWLDAHAIAAPHLWTLDHRGEPCPLVDRVAAQPDDLAAYWAMVDAVRAVGGPLIPLPRHLDGAIAREEQWWEQGHGWERFATDLPQSLLDQGAKVVWHSSHHFQYQRPPEDWPHHRPWRFLQTVLLRLGQAPAWLHGSWLWRSHQWDAFLAWQAPLKPKHWWDADRRALAEAAMEAAKVGHIPVLDAILKKPDFEWETRTAEGYTRDRRSTELPRDLATVALTHAQSEVLALLRDQAIKNDYWANRPLEWIRDKQATEEGLATWWATDRVALEAKQMALRNWLLAILEKQSTEASLLEALKSLADNGPSEGSAQGWLHVVQQAFLHEFADRWTPQSSPHGRPKARQAFEQRVRYLLDQGARWPEPKEGQPAWACLLATHGYALPFARMLHRLGADLTQPIKGQSVLTLALIHEPIQDLKAWARLGLSIAPAERFRHFLATTLGNFAASDPFDDLVTALKAGWPTSGVSDTEVQRQWDLVRHPVQLEALATLTPTRPDDAAVGAWLSAPAAEFGVPATPRDPWGEPIEGEPNQHLQCQLELVQTAHRLAVRLREGSVLHQAMWIAKYDDEKGVALIDTLVAMGADPMATNSEEQTADEALNSYPIVVSQPVLHALRRHRGQRELALKHARMA